jgi:hypothetical protein
VDGPGPDVLWIGCAVVGAVAAVGYTVLLRRALAEHDGPGAGAKKDAAKKDAGLKDSGLKDAGQGAVQKSAGQGAGRSGAAQADAGQLGAAPVAVEKAEPIGG